MFLVTLGVLARFPLTVRRRALYVLFRLAAWRGRAWSSGLGDALQSVLRLPRRTARRLDNQAAFYDWLAELEWLALARRSQAGVRRDLAKVAIDHPETIRRVAETGRPVVLAPLHMGTYTPCLGEIMFRCFPGRPMLILRRRDDMPLETHVMNRLREFGVDMRLLKVTDRAAYLAAMRFAQTGAVVVVFCDLPPSFGMPATMPVFGKPFRFAFGLASVARMLDAIVLPIHTVAGIDRDEVRVGHPFQVQGQGEEGRWLASARIARHIETAIGQAPEQWHLWASLTEYLPPPDSVPEQPLPEEPAPLSAIASA